MKIIVVAVESESIKANLNSMLPGNTIITYNSVTQLYDFANKSSLKTDALIIDDRGVFPYPIDKTNVRDFNLRFNILDDLFRIQMLRIGKVYFLNKTHNVEHYERYNFIKERVQEDGLYNGMEFYISTQDEHRVTDIKKLLMSIDKQYGTESSRNVILQRKRGASLQTAGILEPFETDKAILAVLSPEGSVDIDQAKKLFRNNNEEISIVDKSKPVEEVPEIKYLQDAQSLKQEVMVEDKIVMVTGTVNSGVTTTAMMLGHSALAFGGKVLLIDLNTDNMGLSYLAAEVLYPEAKLERDVTLLDLEDTNSVQPGSASDVTILNLEDIYKDGPLVVERDSLSSNRLHIMTISLPLISAVKDIQFMVINILERIAANYRYIILDVPLKCLDRYAVLASRYVDRVVLTSIPYMNKMVSALSELKSSYLTQMKAFKNNKVVAIAIGMADRNGMDPISREIYRKYSEHFLGKTVPCTGIFSMDKREYYKPTVFNEIMAYNGRAVQEYLYEVEVQPFIADKEKNSQVQASSTGFVRYTQDPVSNLLNNKETVESIQEQTKGVPTAHDVDMLGHSNLAMINREEGFQDFVEEAIRSTMDLEEEEI